MTDQPETTTHELLRELNASVKRQMGVWYTLRNGIIYGVGFVIGSSIIAAILINGSLLLFGHTGWMQAIIRLVNGS